MVHQMHRRGNTRRSEGHAQKPTKTAAQQPPLERPTTGPITAGQSPRWTQQGTATRGSRWCTWCNTQTTTWH